MKAPLRWKIVQPGYYRLLDKDGMVWAWIERGAESGTWWWEAWAETTSPQAGNSYSLAQAKRHARDEALR